MKEYISFNDLPQAYFGSDNSRDWILQFWKRQRQKIDEHITLANIGLSRIDPDNESEIFIRMSNIERMEESLPLIDHLITLYS